MAVRIGVGPTVRPLTHSALPPSFEGLVVSSAESQFVVIDDPAAQLRETDFLKIYADAPLARIVRRVGPWRAGIGRTDPTWPLATTFAANTFLPDNIPAEALNLPSTSGYEERIPHPVFPDFTGMSVDFRISDPALREMWVDSLKQTGAELGFAEADVLISDLPESDLSEEVPMIVSLRPDPWNAAPPQEGGSSIAASVLDSPALVMQRIADAWTRDVT